LWSERWTRVANLKLLRGHVGLAGNSAADSAAKDALLLPVSGFTVPHSDYKSLIRLQAQRQWQLATTLEL